MIAILDYGSGNIRAIANIYDSINISYSIVTQPSSLTKFSKIIIPGVGAFDETMKSLNKSGLRDVLDEAALVYNKFILGICVGMQILGESSEEGSLNGLGWIPGKVKLFDKNIIKEKPKLPHMGWNSIYAESKSLLLRDIDFEEGFYFLHSFYFECKHQENILSTTNYGINFPSSISYRNIFGVQFHPEKSHRNGIQLLKNFADL